MIARHVMATRASVLAETRQVPVTCSTETLGRDGMIVVTSGIGLAGFCKNPVVLWQHNPDWPIARTPEIGPEASALGAVVQFPTEGASPRSDEVYNLSWMLAGYCLLSEHTSSISL